jgi:hypothetical protein
MKDNKVDLFWEHEYNHNSLLKTFSQSGSSNINPNQNVDYEINISTNITENTNDNLKFNFLHEDLNHLGLTSPPDSLNSNSFYADCNNIVSESRYLTVKGGYAYDCKDGEITDLGTELDSKIKPKVDFSKTKGGYADDSKAGEITNLGTELDSKIKPKVDLSKTPIKTKKAKENTNKRKAKGRAKANEKIGKNIYEEMKKQNCELPRKCKTDCLNKKSKVNFSKMCHKDILVMKIKYKIEGELQKLRQNQISKINIDHEKNTLLKKLSEVYKEDSFENRKILEDILEKASQEEKDFLNMRLHEIYNEKYLGSDFYNKNLELLKRNPDNKYDANYLKLYEEHSKNYVNYFFNTDANDKKN